MNVRLPSEIVTNDLIIRRWVPDDAEAMADLIADSLDHLRPWMAWAADEPKSLTRRLAMFERWDRRLG